MKFAIVFRFLLFGLVGFVVAGAARGVAADTTPAAALPATQPKQVAAPKFRKANVKEFDELRLHADAVVVDVRTAEEFAAGHLPKAGLVDIKSPDFTATIAGLDRSKMYLVNCAAGGRSTRACQSFTVLGFTNVVNLEGGFNAWAKAKPDAISQAPAVALPKASAPKVEKSSPRTVPPAAQPALPNK